MTTEPREAPVMSELRLVMGPTTRAGQALARRPFDVFTPVEDEDDPADLCHVHAGRLLDYIVEIEREAALRNNAEALLADNERLRAALMKYGDHTLECDYSIHRWGNAEQRATTPDRCTCGFAAALEGATDGR